MGKQFSFEDFEDSCHKHFDFLNDYGYHSISTDYNMYCTIAYSTNSTRISVTYERREREILVFLCKIVPEPIKAIPNDEKLELRPDIGIYIDRILADNGVPIIKPKKLPFWKFVLKDHMDEMIAFYARVIKEQFTPFLHGDVSVLQRYKDERSELYIRPT